MLKFLAFADLHYKKNMYASTAAHLDALLCRAYEENVDFVVHLGDFCNDYAGSPEIIDAYLNNRYGLPVFGVYGNHELETRGNSMETVTPLLCGPDVAFGGEGVGYWHYDHMGYRLIGLDTNYSYNSALCAWQHNLPASWGAPEGNVFSDSLAPQQLRWLDGILADAHDKGLRALVFSHSSLSGEWDSSPDASAARDIFAKYPGTVAMCLNGHLHTDHFCVKDDIAYFDVNTVLNGYWKLSDTRHYSDEHTFIREAVDGSGNFVGTEEAQLNMLTQATNTWFFEDPLSAVVEINGNEINIAGGRTRWKYDIAPDDNADGVKPEIPDRRIIL